MSRLKFSFNKLIRHVQIILEHHYFTLCLLVSSADYICKDFGPRSGLIRPDLGLSCGSIPDFSIKLILKKKNRQKQQQKT